MNVKKLDKDISKKKKEKENKEILIKELRDKIYNFEKEVYTKHLSKDFIELEKIYKKHSAKEEGISMNFRSNTRYEITIDKEHMFNEYSLEGIEIKLFHNKEVPFFIDNEIKLLKKYKFLESNFNIKICELGDWRDNTTFSARRIVKSEKEFKIQDKEKAYKFFNDLFTKKILNLK